MSSARFRIVALTAVAVVGVVVIGATLTGTSGASARHPTHACSAADLRPHLLESRPVSVGTIYAIGLTNVGPSACHTMSFATVRFVGADGKSLGAAMPSFSDAVGVFFPTPIIMGPKTLAFFRLTVDKGAGNNASCRETSYLEITAPAGTVPMRLPFKAAYCGSAYVIPVDGGVPPFPN